MCTELSRPFPANNAIRRPRDYPSCPKPAQDDASDVTAVLSGPQPDSEHTSPEKTGAEETGEAQGREGMSVAAGHADIALPSLIRSVSGKQSRWRGRKGEAQPGESREFLSSPQQVPQTRPLLLLPFPAPSSPLKPAGPQRGECMRQRGEERWAQ